MTTAVAEPPGLKAVQRVSWEAAALPRLPARQVAWALVQASTFALLVATGLAARLPDLATGLALGLGLAAAFPQSIGRGLFVAMGVAAATVLGGALSSGSATIDLAVATLSGAVAPAVSPVGGAQILAGGLAAGLGLPLVAGWERGRALWGAMAGAATAGLGAWVALRLVPVGPVTPALAAIFAGLSGLVAAQTLLVVPLTLKSASRIPNPSRIRAALGAAYQEPCLRAWQIDQSVASQSPDADTRDGLGEVAAWIYRLQWMLQDMDKELEANEPVAMRTRIVGILEEAEDSSDPFTRERRLATAKHLEQLLGHRDTLARERSRTNALAEYAGAYLEEARAGLALARIQPGAHTPERLDDVLGRLRSYSAERAARRRTAQEIGLS